MLFAQLAEATVVVEGIRVWRAPDHTRIVLDLSGPVEHVIAPLSNPERLVLDIPNTRIQANPDALPIPPWQKFAAPCTTRPICGWCLI
jgi:N-acetylmuramoyl-L-alanine amidase